jgi:hypothetical protein
MVRFVSSNTKQFDLKTAISAWLSKSNPQSPSSSFRCARPIRANTGDTDSQLMRLSAGWFLLVILSSSFGMASSLCPLTAAAMELTNSFTVTCDIVASFPFSSFFGLRSTHIFNAHFLSACEFDILFLRVVSVFDLYTSDLTITSFRGLAMVTLIIPSLGSRHLRYVGSRIVFRQGHGIRLSNEILE